MTWNTYHSGSCLSRELFDAVQGYAAMGNGYDQEIEGRFEQLRPGSTAQTSIAEEDVFYVYRWGGTGSYHMSAYGADKPGQNVEQTVVTGYVAERIASGEMRSGEIILHPTWRDNYVEMVRAFRASQQPDER